MLVMDKAAVIMESAIVLMGGVDLNVMSLAQVTALSVL